MYEPMGPMLRAARKGGYAVLAVNALNLETAATVVAAAERARSPIVINLYEGHLRAHLPGLQLIDGTRRMAEAASVPVAVGIDHGKDEAHVRRMIHAGFSSVMMDASERPFEENAAVVRRTVEFATAYGASVEAEVGGMGATAGGRFTTEDMMTDPGQAARFAALTGVDALAVSYGSSHGELPPGYTPALRFDRLAEISARCALPLVLHGGSGTSPEDLARSVELGISKVNMGADFMRANVRGFVEAYRAAPDAELVDLLAAAHAEAAAVALRYLEPCGSVGRAR
ncbi:class II fructose-bisphosphate aldolase [Streptomyces sp. NPDC004111]|uniref:class II fructose-bisphosphate aldolase n=1 Tax=Streptomyces sp. NPDC004111 TaxID=3364690 RepID=UPI0036A2E1DF